MMTYLISYTTFEGYYDSTIAEVECEDELFDWIREINHFEGRVTGYRRIK